MVKNRAYLILLSVSIVILLMAGCDTKKDDEFPVITVSKPTAGSIYENGDTIKFSAVISDNYKLNAVEISLNDENNKPLLQTISIRPDKNPFTFQGDYVIDDPTLPGGKYQLRFRALDDENVTNKFIEIQVIELDRELLYPVIVTHPEASKWVAYKMNSGNTWEELYTHSGDYCGSAVNSAASLLYMCGIYQSELTAVKLSDGLPLWHIKPGFNQTFRWFEHLSFSNQVLYASCTEGNIRGYNKSGTEAYKSGIYANMIPGSTALTKNFIVASFTDVFSSERILVAFHNTGGLMIYTKFIQTDVVELLHANDDNVLVFSNSNGQGEISIYDGSDNSIYMTHSFPDGTFKEAATMDNDNYLVATSAGLYWFRLSNNSLTPFATKQINGLVACDNTSQLVYTSSDKILEIYTFPFATLVESYPLPDTLADLHLVFNK
jgi:hypothetical protein